MGAKFSKRNNSVSAPMTSAVNGDIFSDELASRLKSALLQELCKRPSVGLTEVRRDGKDNAAIEKVIRKEFDRCAGKMDETQFVYHMSTYATACWVS